MTVAVADRKAGGVDKEGRGALLAVCELSLLLHASRLEVWRSSKAGPYTEVGCAGHP